VASEDTTTTIGVATRRAITPAATDHGSRLSRSIGRSLRWEMVIAWLACMQDINGSAICNRRGP
jgi:hypothetical protein